LNKIYKRCGPLLPFRHVQTFFKYTFNGDAGSGVQIAHTAIYSKGGLPFHQAYLNHENPSI